MSFSNYIAWLLRSRKGSLVVIGFFISVVLAAIGLKNLGLASDYKIFFDEKDKGLETLEQLQSVYTKTENVFVMIEPPGSDVFSVQTITLVHDITEALWQVPFTSRVDSITNYPFSLAEGEDIYIEEFVPRNEAVTPENVDLLKREAPREDDLVGNILTANGSHTAVNLTLHFPAEDNKAETLAVDQAVTDIIDTFQAKYPDHKFYVSGIAIMNAAFIQAAKKDFKTLIPLMMLFVLIFAGVLLGSLRAASVVLLVVLLAFVGALGVAGWLGISLSAPSISAPIIMFTVIVASSIHILSYVRRRQLEGAEPNDAVIDAYSHNAAPILLSHVTTIIGFLSMNMSDSPPFRDLGNMVVFGVIISALQIFTILPFFLARLKFKRRGALAFDVNAYTKSLGAWVLKYRLSIICVLTPLAFLLAGLALQNRLDDNLIRYFDESVKFRADAEAVDEYFSGLYNIDYSVDSGSDNGIFAADYLSFVQEFEQWLVALDDVVSVESPLHQMKKLNKLMHSNDQNFYRIPQSQDQAAQNFLLYEMSLPFGRETDHFISIDKSKMKLTVRMRNMSSEEVLRKESQINEWLELNLPKAYNIQYSSPALIFSHIGSSSIVSLLEGAFFALVIISLSLIFVFRSLSLGVVSLIPNLLPIAAAFGVWFLLNGQISMGLAGVAAMAIGIVVDDTVHFLFQFVRGIRNGQTKQQSLLNTFDKTMSAIILSSVLLVVGFLMLSSSSFEKNSDIGVMTSITILLALLFDLLFLPAIASYFVKGSPTAHHQKTDSKDNMVISGVTNDV